MQMYLIIRRLRLSIWYSLLHATSPTHHRRRMIRLDDKAKVVAVQWPLQKDQKE